MDTYSANTPTDALGRPSGPRRKHTVEEKCQIVEETLKPGVSVAVIARQHEVNANLVFGWRRLYQKGLLQATASPTSVPLLPVELSAPTVVPKRAYRRRQQPAELPLRKPREEVMEIELASGGRVRLRGKAATRTLERLIEELCRR